MSGQLFGAMNDLVEKKPHGILRAAMEAFCLLFNVFHVFALVKSIFLTF